jgi:hypothetical protein
LFLDQNATALVSSAACGADLIAQQEAGLLSLGRKIVLGSPAENFRRASVTDRPGNWGPLFDQIVAEVAAADGLAVLEPQNGTTRFAATNEAIVRLALQLGNHTDTAVTAVLVWDGMRTGKGDWTAHFGDIARSNGLPVKEISTL